MSNRTFGIVQLIRSWNIIKWIFLTKQFKVEHCIYPLYSNIWAIVYHIDIYIYTTKNICLNRVLYLKIHTCMSGYIYIKLQVQWSIFEAIIFVLKYCKILSRFWSFKDALKVELKFYIDIARSHVQNVLHQKLNKKWTKSMHFIANFKLL